MLTPKQPGDALIGITPRRPATRVYSVMIMRHGYHFEYFPGRTWHSNCRIREFTHIIFQKWFGRQPDRRNHNWHVDGFMAECNDRRGNCVQVEQVNHGDPRHTDGTWNQVRSVKSAPLLLLTWPTNERRAS